MKSKSNDPWRNFPFFSSDPEHWFDSKLLTGIRSNPSNYPPINLEVRQEHYDYYVFIPGLDKDKLNITVDKKLLTISGETPNLIPDSEDVSVHRRERTTGKFARSLNLHSDTNSEDIRASYINGVLNIKVKRQPESSPSTIRVE